jgi:TolB-like protein/class 3 adenylate cyclase
MAADIAGYSRLMSSDEEGTMRLLSARRKEMADQIAAHGGRIANTAGDSVLAEFGSAVEAVACAIAIQQTHAAENAKLPTNRQVAFRLGIHLGDVMVSDGDLFGDGVNVTARLQALAEPGGIALSGKVHDEVDGKVSVSFVDAGEHELKNIARSVRVWHVELSPLGDQISTQRSGPAEPSETRQDRPSIAVLPFTNMSGDPEQEYFSDGITEDIITELSRFHSLFVVARNSSFTYKGRSVNVIEIGRNLGVRYIAEGSVRRAANRVRVTAQLVDARTGNHLWAERFDRELADLFAVQDDVARRIVTSIAPLVQTEWLQHGKRKLPSHMQAYDYVLKAKQLVDNAKTATDLKEARELCDRAIQIDPTYARAHAYKSQSYVVGIAVMEADDVNEWRTQALQCAEQAVALDSLDAVTQWALGEAAFHLRQYDRGLRHMTRAISFNPNDADVLAVSSYINAVCGHMQLALQHMDMALERNPYSPPWYQWLKGLTFYLSGRFEDAFASLILYGQPNANVLKWRILCLVRLERIAEARADMQALIAIKPNFSVTEARKFYEHLPDIESHIELLRRAGLPE